MTGAERAQHIQRDNVRVHVDDAEHCPRCGLRGEHECLSSTTQFRGASSLAAAAEAATGNGGVRERRFDASVGRGGGR